MEKKAKDSNLHSQDESLTVSRRTELEENIEIKTTERE